MKWFEFNDEACTEISENDLVVNLCDEKFKIDIGENEMELKTTSVLNLKTKIINDKALGKNPENLRLIFAGKQLENEKKLSDYGITDKSLIMMVLRVTGGLNRQHFWKII